MAISPSKILSEALSDNMSAIMELDSILTRELRKEFTGHNTVTIARPSGYSHMVIQEVLKRFRAEGWQVNQQSHRNEDYLTFSVAPSYGDSWK